MMHGRSHLDFQIMIPSLNVSFAGSMQSILTQCRRSNKFYEDPDLRKKISYLQSHYEKLSEVEFDDGCGPHDRYMLAILSSIKAVADLFDNLKHTEL